MFYDLYEASSVVASSALDRQAGVTPIPWPEFTARVLELYGPTMRANATRRTMRYALENWLPAMGVRTTADLDTSLIARFIESLPSTLSSHTVRGRLVTLRTVSNFAFKWRGVRISPFQVRSLRDWIRVGKPQAKRHHSRETIARVLAEMKRQVETTTGWEQWRARRTYALTATIAYCGLRRMEACHLQVSDIDLDAEFLSVVSRSECRLKTVSSADIVPMAPPLILILRDWLGHRLDRPPGFTIDEACPWVFPVARRGRPWNSGAPGTKPGHRMLAVAKSIGVEGFTPLSLRHSLATHLLSTGCGKAFIQRMLRHSNSNTQAWYVHSDLDDLRAGVKNIEF